MTCFSAFVLVGKSLEPTPAIPPDSPLESNCGGLPPALTCVTLLTLTPISQSVLPRFPSVYPTPSYVCYRLAYASCELHATLACFLLNPDVQPEAPSTGSDRVIPLLTVLREILSADIERPMSSDAASHRKLNHHEPRHARRPYGRRYRSPSAAFGTISSVPRCYRIIRATASGSEADIQDETMANRQSTGAFPEQAHDLEYLESPFSRSWRIRDMYEGSFHVTPAVPEVNQ